METLTHLPPASLRVLLVDDDQFQLDFLSELLEQLGVQQIDRATSGARALQQLAGAGGAPHLLICDLHMPGMDGFQFMESVASSGCASDLLIVSGQDQTVRHSAGLVAQLRRLNFHGVLAKPPCPDQLARVLSSVGARRAQASAHASA